MIFIKVLLPYMINIHFPTISFTTTFADFIS